MGRASSQITSLSGNSRISSVCSTEAVSTVYNLRVADHHTYFVGGSVWGWDVWVHNAIYAQVGDSSRYFKQAQAARSKLANDASLPSWKRRVFSRSADGSKDIGNIAIAKMRIDGGTQLVQAFSGGQRAAGFLDPASSRLAKRLGVSARELQDPASHTEVKILAHILATSAKSSRGKVTIFSELAACSSCSNAIARFGELRPNVKISFKYRFDYK